MRSPPMHMQSSAAQFSSYTNGLHFFASSSSFGKPLEADELLYGFLWHSDTWALGIELKTSGPETTAHPSRGTQRWNCVARGKRGLLIPVRRCHQQRPGKIHSYICVLLTDCQHKRVGSIEASPKSYILTSSASTVYPGFLRLEVADILLPIICLARMQS